MVKRLKRKPGKGPKKSKLVDEARALFARSFDVPAGATGSCLYLTACIIAVAQRHGIRLVPQAGSAHWRIVPEHLDDGVSPTHFSYVWEGAHVRALASLLPEIHVWAANPATQEIVDLTAGEQPEQCVGTSGLEWLSPAPPAFVWHRVDRLPCGSYEPSEEATRFAVDLMLREVIPSFRS